LVVTIWAIHSFKSKKCSAFFSGIINYLLFIVALSSLMHYILCGAFYLK